MNIEAVFWVIIIVGILALAINASTIGKNKK